MQPEVDEHPDEAPPNNAPPRIRPNVPIDRCVAVSRMIHPITINTPTTKCSGPRLLAENAAWSQCTNDQPLGL